jgi:hypothetical protein
MNVLVTRTTREDVRLVHELQVLGGLVGRLWPSGRKAAAGAGMDARVVDQDIEVTEVRLDLRGSAVGVWLRGDVELNEPHVTLAAQLVRGCLPAPGVPGPQVHHESVAGEPGGDGLADPPVAAGHQRGQRGLGASGTCCHVNTLG